MHLSMPHVFACGNSDRTTLCTRFMGLGDKLRSFLENMAQRYSQVKRSLKEKLAADKHGLQSVSVSSSPKKGKHRRKH